MELNGSIISDTVYIDNNLVAKNVTISLPAVNWKSVTLAAMGDLDIPIPLTEALEPSIKKIGIDKGLRKSLTPEPHTLECRFVQNVQSEDGSTRMIGCKSFMRVVPKGIPGLEVTPGSSTESDIAMVCTRYQLYVDGVEQFLIDKLNNILRVNGKDYAKEINKLL